MKKLLLIGAGFLLTLSLANAQNRQVFEHEPFENVDLDGNIRLYLEYGKETKVALEAKKDDYIDDYKVAVRNGTLYVHHRNHGYNSTPKIEVYVRHPGIHRLDMDGLVSVYTKDPVRSEHLKIKGDGLIRGDIDVIVNQLDIGLDGLAKMTVVGRAKRSDLSIDGMGKIDARGLQTAKLHQSADGLASIKVGQ